jgi:hypothetical protein
MATTFKANDLFPTLEIQIIVNLSVGDYVEAIYFQNSGTSQTVYVAASSANFYAYYLGA